MLEQTAHGNARISGPLDMNSCAPLLAPLTKLAGAGPLRIDLSDVTRVDSAALALLLSALRAADSAGHTLSLEHCPSRLTALLNLYSLSELLPSHSSKLTAVEDLLKT